MSSPAQNRAAAQKIETDIEPQTKDAGAAADHDTNTAVKAFQPKDGDGWLTSAALKSAHETWGHQVGNLMNRLSYEKSALRGNATLQHGTDIGVGSGLRGISALDRL
ncbi:hypothetical protein [Streptomyces sp. NPDC001851]|uniref:hypothetical protein n=1 Tax=Streptomyces sp. NPDC001851 TaxID=3154529 RepID=UPI00332AF088